MSLMSALQNAISGLTVSQAQIDLVSRNVANVSTVGYTRRVLNTEETSAAGITSGAVRETGVERILDMLLQKQLRTESAGAGYTSTQAGYLNRVDAFFGAPGSKTGLNTVFADFSTALQQLAANPGDANARQAALAKAQVLTSSLNSATNNVQSMRGEIESTLASDTQNVNSLLDGIQQTTDQLSKITDSATRQSLLDQRDKYIDQLSTYFDIRVADNGKGSYSIYTTSGTPLFVEGRSLRLQFNGSASVSANSTYNSNPAKSSLGQLSISDSVGGSINLTNNGSIRSGKFAALFNLRDTVLPQTQSQIDQFAASLAQATGDQTVASTAATSGAQSGFKLDLSALKSGNVISLDYTVQPAGTKKRVSFIAVNNPSALPLPANATPDPNDTEYGIDFSKGIPDAIAQISAALGSPFSVSNPSTGVVQILDDGAANTLDINALSARATNTALSGQGTAMPLFVDSGASPSTYTGSFDSGSQQVGFAGRISINPAVLADPSTLVNYQAGTGSADPARPNFLRDQIQSWQTDFAPSAALNGSTAPFHGTPSQYLDRVIASQSQAAANAKSLSDGQAVVVSSLKNKISQTSGVQTDTELGNLIQIQNTYSANARLVSAVKDMFDTLMRM